MTPKTLKSLDTLKTLKTRPHRAARKPLRAAKTSHTRITDKRATRDARPPARTHRILYKDGRRGARNDSRSQEFRVPSVFSAVL